MKSVCFASWNSKPAFFFFCSTGTQNKYTSTDFNPLWIKTNQLDNFRAFDIKLRLIQFYVTFQVKQHTHTHIQIKNQENKAPNPILNYISPTVCTMWKILQLQPKKNVWNFRERLQCEIYGLRHLRIANYTNRKDKGNIKAEEKTPIKCWIEQQEKMLIFIGFFPSDFYSFNCTELDKSKCNCML